MHSKTTYLVELQQDDNVILVGPGRIPSGTILNGRTMLTVEGPGWDFAPQTAMTRDQYQQWREELEAKGYRFTVTQW